jgi:multidrug efflux pump
MTGTGMLALAGIVVNHNIVLIDTFHRLRDAGMEPIEAVVRSSAQRLRPVFLTTITAIGGLVPMMAAVEINFWTRQVTIGGPNGLMWVQLSTAIVFGLGFSKMITLGLVPAMLALPYRWRERRARKRGETYTHAIPDNVVADMNRRRAEREAAE